VTKSVDAETAAALVELGVRDLAENRVDALERKAKRLRELGLAPRWHLIGHLQRNKARRAAGVASVVHSVDSLRLLETLERVAEEQAREIDVYLEVKLVDVAERTGSTESELGLLLDGAPALRRVRLVGLMTLAEADPLSREGDLASQARARATFRRLRELRDGLSPARRARFEAPKVRLSMGMSADLEAAVAEGADIVRVGSALFADDAAAAGDERGG
jgi:pyridoxal phosphate enzyme (YggS family)